MLTSQIRGIPWCQSPLYVPKSNVILVDFQCSVDLPMACHGSRISLVQPRSFAQFSMSQRSNDRARGEPGDEAIEFMLHFRNTEQTHIHVHYYTHC